MRIKRDRYLEALKLRMNNGMVKVITGMRRSGKSHLLNIIFFELISVHFIINLSDFRSVFRRLRLFSDGLQFAFQLSEFNIRISHTIQFVDPAECLAVVERDNFIIAPCVGQGERQVPLRLLEP